MGADNAAHRALTDAHTMEDTVTDEEKTGQEQPVEEKHSLKHVAAEKPTEQTVGYAIVTLSEWADPSIGAGPP